MNELFVVIAVGSLSIINMNFYTFSSFEKISKAKEMNDTFVSREKSAVNVSKNE